jgi:hypothetical protein
MITYVPRSPRRATRLRAVVDDGSSHAVGRVRDMSTSGLFVEATMTLPIGQQVAVVPLVGELDGERLPAEIARIGERGVAIRFVGLDLERRQRLRRMFGEQAPLTGERGGRNEGAAGATSQRGERRLRAPPPRAPLPALPASAPVVLLTDDQEASASELVGDVLAELEAQLLELGRRNGALTEQLAEAEGAVEELLRGEEALMREIHRLEALLRKATTPRGARRP